MNLTQMTITSTTVGKDSLRRNGVAIIVNKRVRNTVLGCNLKNDRIISVHFQGKPFTITVNQAYVPTSNAKEAEVKWFYADLKLTPKKRCPFHHRGLECKSRKSRNTWITGRFGLGVQNKQGKGYRVSPREHTGHCKHPLPTTQEETLYMDISRWSALKSG